MALLLTEYFPLGNIILCDEIIFESTSFIGILIRSRTWIKLSCELILILSFNFRIERDVIKLASLIALIVYTSSLVA